MDKLYNLILEPIFIKNIQTTYGEVGENWLTQLPAHLEFLCEKWSCDLVRVLSRLSYNFVCLVKLRANHELRILKTAPEGSTIISEINWLKHFKNNVPVVFEIDEARKAFMLEYLNPGITLKSHIKNIGDESATRIIAENILALQSQQPISLINRKLFKHVSELAESLKFLKNHLEDFMIEKACDLFRDLSLDRSQDFLLHGDLHHDNVLQSGTSWKVIDPHGYIGDPAAEIGAMMHNPHESFPDNQPLKKIIENRLKILAEMLPFDAKRIQAWAFCLALLSAAWDIEGFGEIADRKIEIAMAIDGATC